MTCQFEALGPAEVLWIVGSSEYVSEGLAVDEFCDDVRLTCVQTDPDHAHQPLMALLARPH